MGLVLIKGYKTSLRRSKLRALVYSMATRVNDILCSWKMLRGWMLSVLITAIITAGSFLC
jgi:hypothetical protein